MNNHDVLSLVNDYENEILPNVIFLSDLVQSVCVVL